MAKFVSDQYGEWYPRKEKVGLVNTSDKTITVNGKEIPPGDPFIYEGPDRDALTILHQQDPTGGATKLGKDFRIDPEFLSKVRQLGFKTVNDYFKFIGYDEEKAKEKFEKEVAIPSREEIVRAKDTTKLGGGRDLSGNNQNYVGGFGTEVLKKA